MVRVESKQPRKQRKARYAAPAHARNHFLRAPLAPALREQYHRRSMRVVVGDTVKVLRGESAGTEGLVDMVDTKRSTIVVQGVSVNKADGTEVPRPIPPSNVQITRLNLKDPKRAEKLGGAE
ncbi:MAG TPA: 50S ribosomal protein L24 [Methanolinea sp.]|nr:50S ribosomal protein L24 [Methanolinea sp.]HPC54593.1 50S ribosomal protein L24 [Methanolinea sp.]HQE85120.1 50S ribosomal protein L24 [Methanolinea sp.]HQI13685.1 50S ribosomal protein L24 [Methanolinea sp.]HQJ18815.1 50S ribosomal protein L24 [Methanolinea sp.]